MKILDKHLIKELLPAFLYCLGLFICLYIVIDLFANLEDIIRQNVKIITLGRYYSAFLPIILTQITPIALLLSVLYSVGTLNRHNEIVAIKASGISIWRIIMPLLFLGLLISLASFVVENKIVPQSYATYSYIKEEKIEPSHKKLKEEVINDITFYGENNRIFYAESFNIRHNLLKKVIILQHNENGNLIARITTDEAKWQDDKWIFKNCAIYRLDKTGGTVGEALFFNEKIFRLAEKPQDFRRSQQQTRFMSIFRLHQYIKKLSSNGYRPRGLLIDFYNKISFPFINLIIVLLGASFALLPNKGGALMYLGVALAVGFLYYAIIITSVAVGKAGLLPPLLSSWLANIIFAMVGFIFLLKLPT